MANEIFAMLYCQQCGQMFFYTVGPGRPRKFCSNACRQKHWREAHKREYIRKHWQPQPEY